MTDSIGWQLPASICTDSAGAAAAVLQHIMARTLCGSSPLATLVRIS